MKAVIAYGRQDVRVEEIPEPRCGPGEVVMEVDFGGICGSDLHYWLHGATGLSVIREPMILGHEVAGRIVEIGSDVTGFTIGQPITPHPSPACAGSPADLAGSRAYFGSAGTMPHTQGAFARYKAIPAYQVRPLPPELPLERAALTEPLSVAFHAVTRAGGVAGRNVLVSGAGPVGNLVVAALRRAGAAHITASDLSPFALELATRSGADEVVNIAAGQALPAEVDIVIEASGAPMAVGPGLEALRFGGTMVQLGNLPLGDMTTQLAVLVARELACLGSFRFQEEIVTAIGALADGIAVDHIVTHVFPVDDALVALAAAQDRASASKVLLDFRP